MDRIYTTARIKANPSKAIRSVRGRLVSSSLSTANARLLPTPFQREGLHQTVERDLERLPTIFSAIGGVVARLVISGGANAPGVRWSGSATADPGLEDVGFAMAEPPTKLTRAIEALWKGPPLDFSRPHRSPLFQGLIEVCIELFPDAVGTTGSNKSPDRQGLSWALDNALRAAGTPWSTEKGVVAFPFAPHVVASMISDAMVADEVPRRLLCPLDEADEWPGVRFGPCEVRRFSRDELTAIFQPARLRRHFPSWSFDADSFSRFSWLIVSETVPLSRPVGSRALPILYQIFDRPFGAIEPHTRAWPVIVERAVFTLLLLPWEEMTDHTPFEWRGFRVPWCYILNPDPFARPSFPPRADSLSWEPDIVGDPDIEDLIETERPVVLPLVQQAAARFVDLNNRRWRDVEIALSSGIFNHLVVHFLVRAFSSDGIDEFLAHVICVEAALGMARDYHRKGRPRVNGDDIGPTERVARRAAALTANVARAQDFNRLFAVRSDFVHGKSVTLIAAEDRIAARTLAREVASSLVTAAVANPTRSREDFLTSLCP